MSKLLSVLALTDKTAALSAAADEVRASCLLMVRDGNSRNVTDTIQALASNGGRTKGGQLAKSRKGAILGALVAAHDDALSARSVFSVQFQGHKGKPSADMTYAAGVHAERIALAFETRCTLAMEPKAKAPKAVPVASAVPVAVPVDVAGMGKAVASDVLKDDRKRTAQRIRALRATVKQIRSVNALLASEANELRARVAELEANAVRVPAKRKVAA